VRTARFAPAPHSAYRQRGVRMSLAAHYALSRRASSRPIRQARDTPKPYPAADGPQARRRRLPWEQRTFQIATHMPDWCIRVSHPADPLLALLIHHCKAIRLRAYPWSGLAGENACRSASPNRDRGRPRALPAQATLLEALQVAERLLQGAYLAAVLGEVAALRAVWAALNWLTARATRARAEALSVPTAPPVVPPWCLRWWFRRAAVVLPPCRRWAGGGTLWRRPR